MSDFKYARMVRRQIVLVAKEIETHQYRLSADQLINISSLTATSATGIIYIINITVVLINIYDYCKILQLQSTLTL